MLTVELLRVVILRRSGKEAALPPLPPLRAHAKINSDLSLAEEYNSSGVKSGVRAVPIRSFVPGRS